MKKHIGDIVPVIIFAVIGLILKFALIGYSFLAYGCFAVAFTALFFLGLKIIKETHPKLSLVLYKLAVSVISVFVIILIMTEIVIISESAGSKEPEAEYAIVLGAGVNGDVPSLSLRLRLEAALDYANKYPDSILIVSGGQGPGENITEAQCMSEWLKANGISPERIILEELAESTRENIGFSQELIFKREPDFSGRVCIITSGYHVFRARTMAEDAGAKAAAYPADSGLPVLTVNYYFREAFAVWHYLMTR